MTNIGRIGATPVASSARRAAASSGFTLPGAAAAPAAPATPVAALGLLALQEAGQDAVRDREARRHGDAMLQALRALQRALLGGGDDLSLRQLEALARGAPPPADPGLAMVQAMILQRTAVELARRRLGAARG